MYSPVKWRQMFDYVDTFMLRTLEMIEIKMRFTLGVVNIRITVEQNALLSELLFQGHSNDQTIVLPNRGTRENSFIESILINQDASWTTPHIDRIDCRPFKQTSSPSKSSPKQLTWTKWFISSWRITLSVKSLSTRRHRAEYKQMCDEYITSHR